MNEFENGPGTDRGRFDSGPVINPVGLMGGTAAALAIGAGSALPLAGGPVAFTHCEILQSDDAGGTVSRMIPAMEGAAASSDLTGKRENFAGHDLACPVIMGVVNVTPDSFSDGGDHADPAAAIAHARSLIDAGADILDIGGESTRPGAAAIGVAEECDRILPVIEAAVAAGMTVSVDTRRAETMLAAVDAGASIVNDVTALTGDPGSLEAVAATEAAVILMHMQGTPETMQDAPEYGLASFDIFHWLKARIAACAAAGIPRRRIAVDPGIGFGKTDGHNMEILHRAGVFHGLGCAVAVGVSRKSFIGRIAGIETPRDRLPGTLAATAIALSRGVQIHRVHDVAAARQAMAVWNAQYDNG
ncbi:MAG: dihydropteroate synthase [Alphaproteobacteria bacterium]